MRRSVARIRGLGFIFWHSRHEFYHIMLGLLWAWFLRERWHQFNAQWIWWSIFGSLLPDADHLMYLFAYGRSDWYSKQIRAFLKHHEWRNLWTFMESGHKHQTNLASHNYFVMVTLLFLGLLSSLYSWEIGVILFGAMVIHYVFDIGDDLLLLGYVNPNWKRWGRGK